MYVPLAFDRSISGYNLTPQLSNVCAYWDDTETNVEESKLLSGMKHVTEELRKENGRKYNNNNNKILLENLKQMTYLLLS